MKHLKSIKDAADAQPGGKSAQKPQKARPAPKAKADACGADLDAKSAGVYRHMKEVVVPEMEFGPKTTLVDAVGWLRDASVEHDSPNIPRGECGFNIILRMGDGDAPAFPKIKMKNIQF